MIVPTKFISVNDSVLGKIIELLPPTKKTISILELYFEKNSQFECIDHFLYALDVLYVLNKINVDFEKGQIRYVD